MRKPLVRGRSRHVSCLSKRRQHELLIPHYGTNAYLQGVATGSNARISTGFVLLIVILLQSELKSMSIRARELAI